MRREGEWIYYFSDRDDFSSHEEAVSILGGKGYSLKEMTLAGLAVPPGFTISADCCVEYLDNGGKWPAGLEQELKENIERLENDAGRKFAQGPEPLLVSVRSGAPVSMPGMMDTILDCGKDAADPWAVLVASVNSVFDSWNSERAVSYRKRNALTNITGTAVNIQMMFPSAVSGVVFTRSPSDPEADVLIIESSFGLGEAVVSGDADPDRFTLSRSGLEVLESRIGKKDGSSFAASETSLSPDLLASLGELAMKVEGYFGYPLDIEFGYDGSKFALLQSRRIRGIELVSETLKARDEERARLSDISGDKRRVWVSHNLSETLKYPTPLTWDIVKYFMSGAGGMGEMYRRLGYSVPDSEGAEFLELICGSIYADPEKIVDMLWRGLPVSCDLTALESDISLIDNPPVVLDPEKADPLLLLRLPLLIWSGLAAGAKARKLKRTIKDRFENEILPRFLAYIEKERSRDLTEMSHDELCCLLDARCRHVLRDFGADSLIAGFLGALSMTALTNLLKRLLGGADGLAAAQELTGSLKTITSDQYPLLQKVSSGAAGMDEFLEIFGHRAAGEMELSVPRWREDADALNRMAEGLSQVDPGTRGHASMNVSECLASAGASCMEDRVAVLQKETSLLLPYRENGKHYLMMGYELVRGAVVELGSRLGLGEDVFFMRREELTSLRAADSEMLLKIEQRKLRRKAVRNIYLPPLVDSEDLGAIGRGPVIDDERRISATPVSPGSAQAAARILFDPKELPASGEAFILVCPSTDPGWTPLLTQASGLIVERGGILSHGALIARDLGVPAVVLPDATRIIDDGSMLILDGSSGAVEILEEQNE